MAEQGLKFDHGRHAYHLILLLILPCIVISLSPATSLPAQNNNSLSGLYLSGQYLYQGSPPAGMEDLFSISLIVGKGRNKRITGYVSTRVRYNFISVKLTNERLTFTTRTISGVHYRFDGRILKIKAEEGDYYYPELEGTLTKFRNGKMASEVTSRFKYEEFGD